MQKSIQNFSHAVSCEMHRKIVLEVTRQYEQAAWLVIQFVDKFLYIHVNFSLENWEISLLSSSSFAYFRRWQVRLTITCRQDSYSKPKEINNIELSEHLIWCSGVKTYPKISSEREKKWVHWGYIEPVVMYITILSLPCFTEMGLVKVPLYFLHDLV